MTETILSEIMTTDLVTIDENAPISEIKDMFKRRGFHHLIVENKNNEVVGIISSEDVSRSQSMHVIEKLTAKNIMSEKPVCLNTDSTLQEAVKFFLKNRWRAIPILQNGKLKGIVTPYDIIFYVFVEENINQYSL